MQAILISTVSVELVTDLAASHSLCTGSYE